MANKDEKPPGYSRCPICGAKTEPAFRPFCSARCRDVDLARWLSGSYAIPGGEPGADEDGEDSGTREDRRAGPREDDDEPA